MAVANTFFDELYGYPYTGEAAFNTHPGSVLTRNANAALFNIARQYYWPILREASRGIALDIACGNGWASYLLSPFMAVIAVDVNLAAIQVIRRDIGKGIFPVVADGASPPFRDETVDLIFMCAGYHHTANRLDAMNEWFRVLKKGGKLVAVGESPTRDDAKLRRLLDFHADRGKPEDGYTISELYDVLHKCDFGDVEYIRIKYQDDMQYKCLNELQSGGRNPKMITSEWGDNGIIMATK